MKKNAYKKAFTLVELSVVIVIISIMLTVVLVSRSLIDAAKANKVVQEYTIFSNGIGIFKTSYDCLPGDCIAAQISDIVIPTACFTSTTGTPGVTYTSISTAAIDSITKRSCALYSLQASSVISGQNLATPSTSMTASAMQASVGNINLPYAQFSKAASWNLRSPVYTPVTSGANSVTLPLEIGIASLPNWSGNLSLILQSATSTADITVADNTATTGGPTYGISANLSLKIDTKFDDGKPYSGNIIGGTNATDFGAATSCNTLAAKTSSAITASSVVYKSNTDLATGCLLTFLITV